ncbi:MAG: glycoside hydrolase family 6 protein [Cellvibrio sp.]|uniref:glycoside hydrolase family 6 protein n=1 Tax=Cellvibrio sp. TaxID=1965322 RepID=UPI002716C3D4|nr:glycoside hydrolase family 6 protein [Cellvibrio sp.]
MKISNTFLRRSATTIVGMLALHSAASYAARCDYVIQNEWSNGFVAAVRITNDTSTTINGWSVNWRYTDGTTRTGSWNANISGSNPFTATGVGWNDRINPGQTIEFGVQGNKGVANSPAQKPVITGAVCNAVASSSSVVSRSSSSIPLSNSSFSSSSVADPSSTSRSSSSRTSTSSSSFSSIPLSCPQGNSWPDCPPETWSDEYCALLPLICRRSSSSSSSSSSRSLVSSSASSISSMDAHPLDNPFVGAHWYVDPIWSEKAKGEVGGDKIARFNTAVWMDRIGAIDPAEGFGLRDHLDAALAQGANLIQVVVYDLPNRDCHALASNGELAQGPNGTLRYRTEYVDALAAIFSDAKYSRLRIIAIIEPDSLPNLVTNLSDPECQLATDPVHGYVANTQYTLNKFSPIPNVYSYVDIGHSGWLGWDNNFSQAVTLLGNAIKGTTAGVRSIAGFVSNTSGYTPIYEPFLDSLASSAFPGSGGGTQVRQAKFYEWNPQFSEVSFVQAWRTRMIAAGFPASIGMLIDTSRNGWGGASRPTAQSTSTVLDTFVDQSRVDRRIHRGNWCNQPGGIGERPQATPAPGIDAYVWVKPPGESDGASSLELSFDPLDPAKGFDRMCDPTYTASETNLGTGALANAPVAGRWFPEAFELLVKNAYPALEDAPASSSVQSSSVRSSSSLAISSVVSSSVASSSLISSSLVSSSLGSSSSAVISSSSSNQGSSTQANQAPIANMTITANGPTILVNGRASTDADGDQLTYVINFGDGETIQYPEAWHTYLATGSYTVTLTVSDGTTSTSTSEVVTAQAATGNRAPIAMLSATRSNVNIIAYGSTSFDEDYDSLTYLWDFTTEEFPGNSTHIYTDCASPTSVAVPRLITLTVFDGELADTQQVSFNQPCGLFEERITVAEFSWRVVGNTLYVDGRDSTDPVFLMWDFGDGGSASGLVRSHTFTEPGVYLVKLTAYGAYMDGTKTVEISVGQISSSLSSSSVRSSSSSSVQSSIASSISSSRVSSSVSSSAISSSIVSSSRSSSSTSSDRNLYTAPKAQVAPAIDGTVDAVWDSANWAPIDVFWLGTQPNPSAQDYSGRYKALWDENYLYLLFDITDERIFDGTRNALERYWEDDTVELFIDENKNGGQHEYNTSAWAYHISTYGDVVDYTTSGPKLLNDHIDVRLVSMGDKHVWEMRVRIYGENYSDALANTPLTLTAGKLMGFSASYIDNDGSQQRESMMGSVDTQGHKNNQGYQNASVFGSMRLVE